MRRKFLMLAAAVLAALPPAVGAAGHGGNGQAAADAASFPTQLAGNEKLAFPLPDPPGPAALAPGVQDVVNRAGPGDLLDLIVTLDRPADHRMETALSRL
ncbi:MAG TPA: hypothetical protein VGR20_12570, partial [Acidimicrobiia bacterium]|nr:hypothetical protein [Acidimicrobiia bacterium]